MRKLLGAIGILIGLWFVVTLCVNAVNAKETTTLEDALERSVKIEKYVDKANNVVCYWNTRHPGYLSCLQIRAAYGRRVK